MKKQNNSSFWAVCCGEDGVFCRRIQPQEGFCKCLKNSTKASISLVSVE
jgi:hypothetical protein